MLLFTSQVLPVGKNDIRYATGQAQGGRDYQEDMSHCSDDGESDWLSFIMCDGHGGRKDGGQPLVAQYVDKQLERKTTTDPSFGGRDDMSGAIRTAHLAIDQEILEAGYKSGSTAATVWINPEEDRIIASVLGDTNVIFAKRSHNGFAAFQPIVDQTSGRKGRWGKLYYRPEIEAKGGFIIKVGHTYRLMGVLEPIRGFGDAAFKQPDVLTRWNNTKQLYAQKYHKPNNPITDSLVLSDPETWEGRASDISFVVIRTDGIILPPQQIVNLVGQELDQGGTPDQAVNKLLFESGLYKGDNKTVTIIDLEGERRADPESDDHSVRSTWSWPFSIIERDQPRRRRPLLLPEIQKSFLTKHPAISCAACTVGGVLVGLPVEARYKIAYKGFEAAREIWGEMLYGSSSD